MLPFRTEIRNTPREQTIKVYIQNTKLVKRLKRLVQYIEGVRLVEVRKSLGRNRVDRNITIFRKDDVDINNLRELVENRLDEHFAYN